MSTITRANGTLPWMAPELLNDENMPKPTFASDIYSFASVMYKVHLARVWDQLFLNDWWSTWQILTGFVPFHDVRNACIIMQRILNGRTPTKPTTLEGLELSEEIWSIIERCWVFIPSQRSRLTEVKKNLHKATPTALTLKRAQKPRRTIQESDSIQDAGQSIIPHGHTDGFQFPTASLHEFMLIFSEYVL
jgi:serine/threonine protein kinase